MKEISDEQLAFAARSGDKAAAEQLLRRYKNSVRGVARSFFLEGGETEDLVQEGMIGLYNAVTDFREGGMSFKNFAYLCINRRIMSAVKSASRKKHIPLNSYVPLDTDGQELISPYDPERAVISVEEQEEFLKNLQSELSPAEFRALSLYMEGLTIAEIAARENKSEKSCENAVQRAKRKAAAILQKQ
ncbi:MAG TPA: sigma-70 family RNA polymerase sigma factor [Candidatus Borkfalkia excrementigallinarum]|uniref:RNA polymerase sigma factor SigS n=1 Tax=Candidatus Borkfalkia excrementigallinarum TaxID=2838506 RepID=A0A9D1ZWB4_9FIRM|nr:sigma-70 family RNA polymerase sigma factor [Candidatus Borkfalkia excrementigallinarum]